jgi:tetratricopeptide (TPR) repeat protein
MAVVKRLEGRFGDAEGLYARPLAIYRKALGAHHPAVAAVLGLLAQLYTVQGWSKEAEQLYDEAQADLEAALGPNCPGLAGIPNNKALLREQLKRGDEAERLLTRAIALLRTGAKTDTPAVAIALHNLSVRYAATDRQGAAGALDAESEAIMRQVYGDRRPPQIKAPILPVWQRDV